MLSMTPSPRLLLIAATQLEEICNTKPDKDTSPWHPAQYTFARTFATDNIWFFRRACFHHSSLSSLHEEKPVFRYSVHDTISRLFSDNIERIFWHPNLQNWEKFLTPNYRQKFALLSNFISNYLLCPDIFDLSGYGPINWSGWAQPIIRQNLTRVTLIRADRQGFNQQNLNWRSTFHPKWNDNPKMKSVSTKTT